MMTPVRFNGTFQVDPVKVAVRARQHGVQWPAVDFGPGDVADLSPEQQQDPAVMQPRYLAKVGHELLAAKLDQIKEAIKNETDADIAGNLISTPELAQIQLGDPKADDKASVDRADRKMLDFLEHRIRLVNWMNESLHYQPHGRKNMDLDG